MFPFKHVWKQLGVGEGISDVGQINCFCDVSHQGGIGWSFDFKNNVINTNFQRVLVSQLLRSGRHCMRGSWVSSSLMALALSEVDFWVVEIETLEFG